MPRERVCKHSSVGEVKGAIPILTFQGAVFLNRTLKIPVATPGCRVTQEHLLPPLQTLQIFRALSSPCCFPPPIWHASLMLADPLHKESAEFWAGGGSLSLQDYCSCFLLDDVEFLLFLLCLLSVWIYVNLCALGSKPQFVYFHVVNIFNWCF